MAEQDDQTVRKIGLSALVAGVAGYITGILTAPKSGKQTRRDIAQGAGNVKLSAEEQLQAANRELQDLIADTKTTTLALSSQAREEFNEAVIRAKDAQNKATTILRAFKAGRAEDPQLNRAIKQAKQAQKNLAKYFKSPETTTAPGKKSAGTTKKSRK